MFRRSRQPHPEGGGHTPAGPVRDARADGGSRGTAAVTLRDVHRRYGRGSATVHALRGVSITLPRGSFTAVMRPSGSGKSTFLQCAAGLDRPSSGSVLLRETELTKMRENKLSDIRLNRLGFIFQQFNLMPVGAGWTEASRSPRPVRRPPHGKRPGRHVPPGKNDSA